jgi:solute carrier family 7 (L-type amino acid transporter), member 9/15
MNKFIFPVHSNIPRSISIAVPIITGLYVFMNLAYMTVLSPAEMVSVPAVAVTFGERVFGSFSFIIPLGVALSTFGCALSIQFGVTRMCFVAGKEGHMLEPLSYVNVRRSTPAPAVLLQGVLTFIFIVIGDIHALIEFASFFIWFFYGAGVVALLTLRRTQPDTHRPYKVPLVVPYFVLFVAIFLSVVPIASDPSPKHLVTIGLLMSGVAVYVPFVYYKVRPKIMDKVTYLLQVLFEAVPPADAKDD